MKTASMREVQHHLSEIIDRVSQGEEVTITRRGRPVARLLPARKTQKRMEWPDFEARMREDFPDGPPAGKPPSELISEGRKERF